MKGEDRLALLWDKLGDYARAYLRDGSKLFSITHYVEEQVFAVRTAIIFRHQDQFCFIIDEQTGETMKVFTSIEGRGVEGFDDPSEDGEWDAEGMVNQVLNEMSAPTVKFEEGMSEHELAAEEQARSDSDLEGDSR